MALLSELFVNALWRGKQFDAGAKKSSKQVKAFEKVTNSAKSALSLFRTTLGAVGVGLTVDFFRSTVQAEAANARFADTLGLSLQKLQAYQAGAKRFGVSQETMNDAFLELSRRSREAAEGTGSLKDTLEVLNIPVEKFLAMPLAERFELLTKRFSKMDESSRNFFADESFGGAADAISGILPNISKVADEFERAGLGTSPEAAARFKKLDEQIAKLSSKLTLVGKQFIVDISPPALQALGIIERILPFLERTAGQEVLASQGGVAGAVGEFGPSGLFRAVEAIERMNRTDPNARLRQQAQGGGFGASAAVNAAAQAARIELQRLESQKRTEQVMRGQSRLGFQAL